MRVYELIGPVTTPLRGYSTPLNRNASAATFEIDGESPLVGLTQQPDMISNSTLLQQVSVIHSKNIPQFNWMRAGGR
jgi:hypothetical protein